MTASRGKQNLVIFSFMCLIAGILLMIGDNGAGIFFFIGLGIWACALICWMIAIMWKISIGIDNELGKHLD